MEGFKYILDPGSNKFLCPSCQKKTFVRFLDRESGNYISENYGRCDRESKCGYYNSPALGKTALRVELLSFKSISEKAIKVTDKTGNIHVVPKSQILETNGNIFWISEWYLRENNLLYLGGESKQFNNEDQPIVNIKTVVKIDIPDPSYHHLRIVDKMYCDEPIEDNLSTYLKTLFDEVECFKAMQNYLLTGTNLCWNNSTIFWQIDQKDRVRGGKIMLYNTSNGKRVKEPYNRINWVHKAAREPNFNLNQCLFGLHRINESNNSIAIVESEKTAVIMSLVYPDVIWLAAGSKQNLKVKLIQPLVGRQIILYPDKGEYNDWLKKAEIIKEFGYKITVSDFLEKTDLDPGSDLADYYLNNR